MTGQLEYEIQRTRHQDFHRAAAESRRAAPRATDRRARPALWFRIARRRTIGASTAKTA